MPNNLLSAKVRGFVLFVIIAIVALVGFHLGPAIQPKSWLLLLMYRQA